MTRAFTKSTENVSQGGGEGVLLSSVKLEKQGEVAAGLLEPGQAADVSMGVSHSRLEACVACTKVTQCSHVP